ncbi:MAG: DUF4301 family protein [Alistipes sp.]|nr:DUF4301 family protein [Alistipes sp.]
MFKPEDVAQIEAHGQTCEGVTQQLHWFAEGFPYLPIRRTAVVGDGILRFSTDQMERFRHLYRQCRTEREIVKFVPASGAATRMFKALFEYLNADQSSSAVDEVLRHIDEFAFSDLLHGLAGEERDPHRMIELILTDKGLNYGQLPKALILFHHYAEGARTAFEEHLSEGAMYAAGAQSEVRIHVTVSPEHLKEFQRLEQWMVPLYEKRYGVHYRIEYSFQKPSTDTVAVTPQQELFRDDAGHLVFRPAGHGALIENLNEVDADLIFVKTIDNVAPDRLKADTITYKEALAGLLLSVQQRCFDLLNLLEQGDFTREQEMEEFVGKSLCRTLPHDYYKASTVQRIEILRSILNRPIRVCGMVKNEGEPGGGPFWVDAQDGSESLQIAESSQIAPHQQGLMTEATHFNPVDLVCGVRNYRGEKFDLTRYVDPKTGFISSKSFQGRSLKALELPGLWNGAMAQWNTLFVEVPITTFSPVKVLNDLLRPQHKA